MKAPKTLTKELALTHLREFSQYSKDAKWINWYSKVAPLKGDRTAKLLLNYKDSKAKVLDLGCGIGLTLASLAKYFPNTIGADIGEKEVLATKKLLKELSSPARVVKYNGAHLPFPKNYFDIVTSIEVIEHVKNPRKYLAEIKRVLKPDGILHITTANKLWPMEPHYKLLFLSYLPKSLASLYLLLTKRGISYDDINLPTYGEFKTLVSKDFTVHDVTLKTIADYKKYGFGKERGAKVILLGEVLKKFITLKKYPTFNFLLSPIEFILLNLSLGWLFIAHPKK